MMMATLLAINNYYYYRAGAEAVFLEHGRMFEALGWNVVPFAMRHPKNLASPWAEFFVEEIEFDAQYSLFEKLRRIPKVIYSFEARRQLGRLLDRVRPDVAHAHNIYHHISPSILSLLKDRGIPTVMTLHDLKIACPAYKMLASDGICERCRGGRLYNVLLHRCIKNSTALSAVVMAEAITHQLLGSFRYGVDRFIVPSRFYIEKLSEWGVPRAKCRYVPNYVEASRYRPEYTAGRKYIYFGRLAPEKGLSTLIRAAAHARCALMIAGVGPELESLRALAATLEADVSFLGHLGGDALHEAVRGARAVVLPSEWYENAPLSLLEAYALGKPVIGARIGGIPELLREGETGFGFVSGNETSLTAALLATAACADAKIEQMGRDARKWVESEFTMAAYRDSILNTYAELGVAVPANMVASA
ncbi:MAG: glycosyltransferase [Steroidobacteraceae bacterium]